MSRWRRAAGHVPGARQLRSRADWFVQFRVEQRTAEVQARLDEAVGHLSGRLDDLHRRLDETTDRVTALGSLSDEVGALRFDLERVVPVVAALEARVERLHRDVVPPEVPTAEQAGPAGLEPHLRQLLDEVRREHAQVRARMSVVAAYEERLRRLEST